MASLLVKSVRRSARCVPSQRMASFSSLADYPATEVSTLNNGVRVATEELGGETATVGLWVDTGSRYETAKNNGVAHFLEHMLFKGTQKRTRVQLETEIEDMGGHLNAYTSREQTVFFAKVPKEKVGQAMDILGDITQNSKKEPQDIERERDTILREMQEVESQMEEVIFDRLHETAFRGSPLSYTILGPTENIKSITRDDIEEYVTQNYTANRMVVAGAGAVTHDQMTKLSEQHFGKVATNPPKPVVMEPARFVGSDIRVRYDSHDLAHVTYAFPTAGWNDPDNFPLLVIQSLLGQFNGTASSVHHPSWLISSVAKKGLAQSLQTFNTQYSDTGLFGLYAVCGKYGQNDLMFAMTEAITALCYNVAQKDLDDAKKNLTLNMLAHLDGNTNICEDIGRQMTTYGRRMHISETIARINAVDIGAVKACANRYFYDRDFALAAIGPLHELPDYSWIRRRTYWLRF